MKLKTLLISVLFLLLSAMLFTACSGKGNSGAASSGTNASGEETVHFYAWTNENNMVPLLDAFNKEYEGKYEMVYGKLANATTQVINTALSSGDPITVMTQASMVDLRTRADSGIYMGLKQFFDKEGLTYADVFGESMEKTMNFNGDYYAIPYNNNINMVFFNKKMFDAAGVPYPKADWTWDDFRATAKRLTSGSGTNKVYGAMLDVAGEAPGGDYYWASIAQQKLGGLYYYNADHTATRFDAPEMKESLQFFYDMVMVDQSCVPYSEYTALRYNDDPVGINGLYNGRFAMLIAPVYACLYLDASYGAIPEGTDIGLANFPRPVGSAGPISITYTSTASIPANVSNPEAAWTTLKFICIDRADLFAGPKAMHPPYIFKTKEEADAFNKIIFTGHPGLDYDMAMDIMAQPRTLVTRDNTVVQGQFQINQLMLATTSRLFNGEITVDACLKELKTKGDQYIADDLKKK